MFADMEFLMQALEEAKKCQPTVTAFCVGCILVARWPSTEGKPVILARGYSRELPGNTHAEANALAKARALGQEELSTLFKYANSDGLDVDSILKCTDVYTTMEPCSVRTSGLAPCADALISAKVRRCFIGVGEPDDFVKCEGAGKLKEAGIEVIWLKGSEEECLKVARRGHDGSIS
ncbi:cytidine deaminase-like protein [Neolentinus lepideus HHB14362 ss-1]|uniref:Cytidine deaminase-like protein n=1 Tax=Neolentinus lepideus HHB14362 ss-1 TaxID=1314782 RepID=A0A165TDS9_9AGAM|nr:cytidine deaminase-like protein [Neolentinus lepideus HHB14362 ss-1]